MYLSSVSAHPIHPPEGDVDPWKIEFLPNCGYKTKVEKGVYKVFKNEEDLASDKPINYEAKFGSL